MCGIIGYTGHREAEPILVEGLRRLEYRGYDSAGLATLTGASLHLRKKAGRIQDLARHLRDHPAPGCTGISHTRWATHGPANDGNAHPHLSANGAVAVVHNGVIENYAALKRQLQADGVPFRSDTDTEVIAQLIARHLPEQSDDPRDLIDAVAQTLALLKGTFGLAVVSPRFPDLLLGARLGSPLVLGIGRDETFLASDPAALAGMADKVVYLQDNQMCVLTPGEWHMLDREQSQVEAIVHALDCETADTDKGVFDHFMLKEIYEQPEALENALRGRLDDADSASHFGGLNIDPQQLRRAERIILTACGTSYHAAIVGEYLFEEFARIPVEVEYASEFRYRNPPIDRNTVVIALTQSGETADTLAALRESKRKGHPTLALCNVVGSSIAREADGGVYLHAGPEIGVASTKAFTNQVAVLAMLALYFGRMRHLSALQGARMIRELRAIPDAVRRTLSCHDTVKGIAERYCHVSNFLYLGRQYHYPVALEGALKLKEISYIHAEGYPAAEMKHGPIALVDRDTPSVFLMPRGPIFDKVMSNLEEVKARGGPVIAVACEGDEEVAARADEVIYVPEVPEYLQPLVSVVPLQLLAYHIALLRGCDVDKPRNLAKSVTVEEKMFSRELLRALSQRSQKLAAKRRTPAMTRRDWTALTDPQLLAQCAVDTYRASGPGGQKRNKTSSAVRLRHLPSGLLVIAEESRSQHENKARALRRIRQALYLKLREPIAAESLTPDELTARPDFGPARDGAGRLHLGHKDPRFWPAVGVVLDVWLAVEARAADAAALLGTSTANLIDFLRVDDKVWQEANHLRQHFGHGLLR